MELFFAISGFILAIPFSRSYFKNTAKSDLKKYYSRRVTRLEPPYILSLIIFFFLNYVTHHNTFSELRDHFAASFFYVHNIIYPATLPLINGLTWTLEIEIQFYILAPFLTYIFKIRNKLNRRLLITSLILIFMLINSCLIFSIISILNYFHFFFIGFLIADFYLDADFKRFFNANYVVESFIGFYFVIWIILFPGGLCDKGVYSFL